MSLHARLLPVLLTVALLVLPAQGAAQEVREAVPHDQVISANPFLLLVEWFNVEWERKVSPSATIAAGFSMVDFDDDDRYRGLRAAYRYYPQGAALSGFYVGPNLGVFNVKGTDSDFEGETEFDETAFGVGFEMGYQWLLGAERQFSLSLGFGLTRIFNDELSDLDVELTVPSLRLVNIGWAF